MKVVKTALIFPALKYFFKNILDAFKLFTNCSLDELNFHLFIFYFLLVQMWFAIIILLWIKICYCSFHLVFLIFLKKTDRWWNGTNKHWKGRKKTIQKWKKNKTM